MTISKKLLLTGLLVVSAHCGATANFAVAKQMLSFAQELRDANKQECNKIAQWLESVAQGNKIWLNDGEQAMISNILEANSTIEVKIASLMKIMLEKKIEQKNQVVAQAKRSLKWEQKQLVQVKENNEKAGVRSEKNWREWAKQELWRGYVLGTLVTVEAGLISYAIYRLVTEAITNHDEQLTATILDLAQKAAQKVT